MDSALVQHQYDQEGHNGVGSMAIERQEEWIKKRKVEKVTTKQIETRVKRQVVLEDGLVVDDSGPQVSTNTVEDTQTKREEHSEKVGGDDEENPVPEGWVALPGTKIVRETNHRKYNTRDQIDERLETEQVQQLGSISHKQLEEAVEEQKKTGKALPWPRNSSNSNDSFELDPHQDRRNRQQVSLPAPVKRILHQSRKHKRIIDQEDTQEKSEEVDGHITTETTKHEHHEEVDDEELPDEEGATSDTSSVHETTKETNNNFTTIKDDNQVEYIAVPHGGDLSSGIKLGRGPHVFSETVHPPQPTHQVHPATGIPYGAKAEDDPSGERTDALTKKPLDLEAEEETRKQETSRWLESHFGSESSASVESAASASALPKMRISSGGINVTMVGIKTPTPETPDEVDFKTSGRYSGLYERTQILPEKILPEKILPEKMGMKSAESGFRQRFPAQVSTPLKRATSFNHVSKPEYSWKIPEERISTVNARKSFLSSMKSGSDVHSSVRAEPIPVFKPVHRRWPPLHPPEQDLEEDAEFIHPARGTVIRLGSYDPPGHSRNHAPIVRSRSMLNKMSPGYSRHAEAPEAPEALPKPQERNRMDPVGMKTTREMNLLNASLQSVPERERPVQRNYYIEVPVSSSGRNPESGGVKNEFSRSKTPPPRPAPPSIASSGNHYATTAVNNKNIRSTESFRHAKSAPMFADEHSHPPVRPLRRKQSKRSAGNKTDSGTQTIHNEMIRPLDHSNNSKPMKKYYLGQDPFNGDPLNPSAPSAHSAQSNNKRQSNGVADIRLEVPEEVSSVQAAPRQPKIQPIPSAQENFRPEWIRQQKIRPTQSWQDNVKDVRPESPEELRYVQTKPRQPKIQPVASAEENIRPEPMRQQQKIRPTKSVEENVVGFRPEEPKVVQQVQTVPRQPKIRPTPSSEENIIAGSGSGSVESGGSGNRFRSTLAASVGRSHSFQLPDRTLVSRRTGPQLNFKLGGSSFRNPESNRGVNPLYKSTSHLNRMNSGVLKSPGIVTSISKSQLDLNKSSAATEPFRPEGTTFYTLPRKRVDKVDPPKVDSPKVDPPSFIQRPDSPDFQPPPPPPVASSPLPDADAESFSFPPPPPSLPSPPSPPPPPLIPANETGRGESFSSIHRRKMEAAKQGKNSPSGKPEILPVDILPAKFLPAKSLQHIFRSVDSASNSNNDNNKGNSAADEPENRSFKERIAMLESAGIQYANPAMLLPRVVSGQVKSGPPPPPKTFSKLNGSSPASTQPESIRPESIRPEENPKKGVEKRQKFLEGLLNTAPELFRHIHGDENLQPHSINQSDVIDGKASGSGRRLPATPSPLNSPIPPLISPPSSAFRTDRSTPQVFNYSENSAHPKLNRIYTSTPVLNQPEATSLPSRMNPHHDLAIRRGSLNSTGSNGWVPLVKIPPAVNYSESSRVRSSGVDPDVRSQNESDCVQSYSKRTTPLPDGFSSETKQSSAQTTVTRSEYTEERQSPSRSSGSFNSTSLSHHIRPQTSGGVIIQLGPRNES